ncbi:recombinase family protein [Streptomyces tunisiensis]|uniref:recombinase family protein n=1 Tax=Streptomyces tunisiensis TaxID=948699 RepID=UPI003EDF10FF
MTPGLRYLACLRLSADSDGSTSIEWQRGVIRHHVSSPHLSGFVVGEAEDTDVSGSMSPFKRPRLGRWLTAKADEFDVIIAARMDRLTRRSMHFNELLEWAQENDKYIVCVEEGFDLSTPPGEDDGPHDRRVRRGRVGHDSGTHPQRSAEPPREPFMAHGCATHRLPHQDRGGREEEGSGDRPGLPPLRGGDLHACP